MNRASSSLMLLPLCFACGAPPAPLASGSAPPTPDRTSAAVGATDATLVSPADRALANRGLTRTNAGRAVPAPDWSKTRASLYILARTRDGVVALVGSGAELHTGEEIELHVSVGRPSYVYLIQVSPNQQAVILYPVEDESARMLPGTDYRMPTSSEVRFALDANVGTERLVFVVAQEPLATGDADVRALIAQLRETGRWTDEIEPAGKAKPALGRERASDPPRTKVVAQNGPLHGAGALRGFIRKTTGTGRALDVEPDHTGVALAFFTFEHVP
jgi:hypothetical protein